MAVAPAGATVGRRGTDDKGLVFLMVDGSLDEPTARDMMTGKAAPLISSFKLSYYTVLNLLRRMEGSGAVRCCGGCRAAVLPCCRAAALPRCFRCRCFGGVLFLVPVCILGVR